jgi:hypothetical protein
MKKSIAIIALLATFGTSFAQISSGWLAPDFDINNLTIESMNNTDACTGSLTPTLTYQLVSSINSPFFYINSSTNLGKQLYANLMLAKSTGRKVGIMVNGYVTIGTEKRANICGVSVR